MKVVKHIELDFVFSVFFVTRWFEKEPTLDSHQRPKQLGYTGIRNLRDRR